MCTLSLAQCLEADADDSQANLMAIDDVFPYLSSMVQSGLDVAQRRPRNTFDTDYDQFVRDFNTGQSAKLRSHHGSSSDETGYDQSSSRDRKQRGKNRTHVRANLKDGKGKKKKCKVEKKLDMTCTICYDPKNDEKSEKCALTPEPKKKNYEYSNDEKYSSKKQHDSHESDEDQSEEDSDEGSDESDDTDTSGEQRSDDEQKELKHHPVVEQPPQQQPQHQQHPQAQAPPPPQPGQYKPVYNSRVQPRYTPFNSRAPQVFPAIFNPSPRYFSQPSNGVRYQNINTPYGAQRVRLITLPNGVKVLQGTTPTTSHNRQRFGPSTGANRNQHGAEEVRPQRDLADDLSANGARSNWPWSLATPQFVQSLSGNWSQCRKIVENQQTCIECLQSDGRKKECMFTNQAKPEKENFFKSYSSTKHYDNEQPAHGQANGGKPKAIVSRVVKHKTHEAFTSLVDHGNGNESTDLNGADDAETANAPDETAPGQQDGAAANIVYGIQKPEQYGLFYQTDPRLFNDANAREASKT